MRSTITLVEPNVFSLLGYVFGSHAPGRSSNRKKNAEGDSKTERFIVAHNLLLSHASAVKVYREEFKPRQGGKIGLVVNMIWGGKLEDHAQVDKYVANRSHCL
jgi:beta-glucosidase